MNLSTKILIGLGLGIIAGLELGAEGRAHDDAVNVGTGSSSAFISVYE